MNDIFGEMKPKGMRIEVVEFIEERDPCEDPLPTNFRAWLSLAADIMGYEYRKAAGKLRRRKVTMILHNAVPMYQAGKVVFRCHPSNDDPTADAGYWFEETT